MVNDICKHPIVHMVLYIHPRWLFCDIWTMGKLRMLPPYAGYPSRSQIGNADAAVFAGLGWLWLHDADYYRPVVHFCCWLTGVYTLYFPTMPSFKCFFKLNQDVCGHLRLCPLQTAWDARRDQSESYLHPACGVAFKWVPSSTSRALRIWPVRAKETL